MTWYFSRRTSFIVASFGCTPHSIGADWPSERGHADASQRPRTPGEHSSGLFRDFRCRCAGLAYLGNLVESVAARGAVVTGHGVAQLGDSINQLIDFGVQISDVAGAQRDRPHLWNFRARHEGLGCIVEPVVRAKFGSADAQ